MSRKVNIYEAKAQLSKLISVVRETGQRVVICKNHVPVVDLVVHEEIGDPLQQDPALQGAKFLTDPTAPLLEEDWPEEYR